MFASKYQEQKGFSLFPAIAAQLQDVRRQRSVGGLGEGAGGLMLGDHLSHVGQAAAALRLAAGGAMDGGGRRSRACRDDVADGAVVQGIADTDEQGASPAECQWREDARDFFSMQLRIVSIRR